MVLGAVSTAGVTASLAVATGPDVIATVGLNVLKKFLTSLGSEEYQPGYEPASKALANALAEAGSARSLMTDAGTAVSRTERMEAGGRSAVILATALAMLDMAAGFVGSAVMPAMAALSTKR